MTVAAIVAGDGPREGKFLFVEESVGGRAVLNQPAGHWEAGETLLDAVVRETLEETGWDIEPTALLGVYEYEPPELGYGFLRFAYLARPLRHHAQRPLDPGIARALWLTADALRAEAARHRSPMVQRCVDDALAGRRHPLALIGHL